MKLNNKQEGVIGHIELLLLAVLVALIGFVGWRVSEYRKDSNNSASSQQSLATIEPLPDDLGSILGFDKVKEIAAKEAADQTVTDLELKNEDGVLVYEVKLSNGKVLVVNATTGEVVMSKDDDESEDEAIPATTTLGVSFAKAIALAKVKHPGVSVRKVELEVEDGKVVISVRFTDGARVDIDAGNGKVTRTKPAKKERSKKSESKDEDESEFEDDGDDDRKGTTESHESKSGKSEDKEDSKDEDEDDGDDDDDDDDDSGHEEDEPDEPEED